MIALVTLAACAVLPWWVVWGLRFAFAVDPHAGALAEERALVRSRRSALRGSVVMLPASAIAGALTVDPVLATRSPVAGSWFFATVCATAAWASLSLAQQTDEERAAMPWIETIGRSLQMCAIPSIGVALSLASVRLVEANVSMIPAARAVFAAALSVAGLLVASPWLAIQLRLWRRLPIGIESDGVDWRVAHLPAPAPFLTHVAAFPWLRTVFVTDGLLRRAPDAHWRSLVRYEVGSTRATGPGRALRWSLSIPLSLVVYVAGARVGADDPKKLVAATVLAVAFTGVASWFANREPSTSLSAGDGGPTMRELAQTLRSLPPAYGQAMPRTAHRPLGNALYDRLFALGHDPGRRRHR